MDTGRGLNTSGSETKNFINYEAASIMFHLELIPHASPPPTSHGRWQRSTGGCALHIRSDWLGQSIGFTACSLYIANKTLRNGWWAVVWASFLAVPERRCRGIQGPWQTAPRQNSFLNLTDSWMNLNFLMSASYHSISYSQSDQERLEPNLLNLFLQHEVKVAINKTPKWAK